ncbi:hypothetical protein MKEN_00894200 [Mycena kentingensis (nom. inval.)]|nr:hypothetical protein MKEN_00894200 [Mycena kentingensis (nom. inval.)]
MSASTSKGKERAVEPEVTPDYLSSLLAKARKNATTESEFLTLDDAQPEHHEMSLKFLHGASARTELVSRKTLKPTLPTPYFKLGKHKSEAHSFRDPAIESAEQASSSFVVPAPPAPPPELSKSGKPLTKRERKALRKQTAGPDWFDLPAPAEADLPRLYREVEALRLRNQLDPKRFYRKEEGEGKGIKGLPKYFAIGTVVPDSTPFSNDNLTRANRKRTLVDELVDDAEAKRYAKRKFEDLQALLTNYLFAFMTGTAAEQLPDLSGSLVGTGNNRLEIIDTIGSGAFGRIYRARNLAGSQLYAVKCVRRPLNSGNTISPDDPRECELQRRVCLHPRILTLHRTFFDEHHHFMVLDFCAGTDLFTAITDGIFVGQTRLIKRTFISILDAVKFCHKLGVYHRDIKPENVLVNFAKGEVLLADFGLATMSKLTRDRECGSPSYIPPECFLTSVCPYNVPADADCWALCIILVNLLACKSPWHSAQLSDDRFREFITTSFPCSDSGRITKTFDPDNYDSRGALLNNDQLKKNVLRHMLPISLPLTKLLTRALSPSPERRPTLVDLRKAIVGMSELYMSDRELLHASAGLRQSAGWPNRKRYRDRLERVLAVRDGYQDSDTDSEENHDAGNGNLSRLLMSPFTRYAPSPNPNTRQMPVQLDLNDTPEISESPAPQDPAPSGANAPNRILNAVRRASIVSVGSVWKPRRFSDASSLAMPGVLQAPVQVALNVDVADASSSEEEDEVPVESKGRRRRSSISVGFKRMVEKLRGAPPVAGGEDGMVQVLAPGTVEVAA